MDTTRVSINLKKVLLLIGLIGIGSLICVLLIGLMKDTPEYFTDFIVDSLASTGTNKTIELRLFYVFLTICFAGICVWGYFDRKRCKTIATQGDARACSENMQTGVIIYVMCAVPFLICEHISAFFLMAALCVLLAVLFGRSARQELVYFTLCFYALFAILRIYNLRGAYEGNTTALSIAAAALACLSLVGGLYESRILRKILECIIPFCLLILGIKKYLYRGDVLTVEQPQIFRYFVILLLVFCIGSNAYHLLQTIRKRSVSGDVSFATCLSVGIITCYRGVMLYVEDMHHPAEYMLSYMEIFRKNLRPYEVYTPVSGLFSVVFGGVNELLGGKYNTYALTAVIFTALIVAISVALLRRFLPGDTVLLLTATVTICAPFVIARTQWILPTLLFMYLPMWETKPKNTRLFFWVLFSFGLGLYYPLYGFAFMLSFMPCACMILTDGIRSGAIIKEGKRWLSWPKWIALAALILCSVPLLLGIVRNTAAYASQTRLADGVTLLGESVPDDFFPYLASFEGTQKLLYYGLWFFMPVVLLSLLVFMLCRLFAEEGKACFQDASVQLVIAAVIFVCASFSYTLLKVQDAPKTGGILGRTTFALFPLLPFITAILLRKRLQRNIAAAGLMGLMLGICIVSYGATHGEDDLLYETVYEVSEEYLLENGTDNLEIGAGFVDEETYLKCTENKYVMDSSIQWTGDDDTLYGGWGLNDLYMAGAPAFGQPSWSAVRSLETTRQNVLALQGRKCLYSDYVLTHGRYYWYYYSLLSDKTFYLPGLNAFATKAYAEHMPEKVYPKETFPDVITNWLRVPGTLGRSYERYGADWLEETDIQIEVTEPTDGTLIFSEEISGTDADFLYLHVEQSEKKTEKSFSWKHFLDSPDSDEDTIVKISFTDQAGEKQETECKYDRGSLLIPLGGNPKWLLERHTSLHVDAERDEETVPVRIMEAKMLRSKAYTLLEE